MRNLPLVDDRVVAFSRAGRSGQCLAFLYRTADGRGGNGWGGVQHGRRRGAGQRDRRAIGVGDRRHDLNQPIFVRLARRISSACRADDIAVGDAAVVRYTPLIGNGPVTRSGRRRGRERLAVLRQTADGGNGNCRYRAGGRDRLANVIGCCCNNFDSTADIGGLHRITGRCRAGDRLISRAAIGGALPSIGYGIVALSGRRRGAQCLPQSGRPGDRQAG